MEDTLTVLAGRLARLHQSGTRLALLFDYDGTLTRIVEHPSQARLQERTLQLLQRLAARPGVHVGVISGRDLGNLRSLVDICGVYLCGSAGLELDLRGIRRVHPEAKNHLGRLAAVARALGDLASQYPGAWIEDKSFGLTLHYRKVARRKHDELRAGAAKLMRLHEPLRVCNGPLSLEVLPALQWDKGSAIEVILEDIGPPVFPVYAGDSENDTAALAATVALGGLALPIGPAAPAHGPYRLADPDGLAQFLRLLETALETRARLVASAAVALSNVTT